MSDETHDRLDRLSGLQAQCPSRRIKALAVAIEVGRHSLEGAGSVKHRRAEPEGMCPRSGDEDIAFVPVPIEPSPGLGRFCRSSLPPYELIHGRAHPKWP